MEKKFALSIIIPAYNIENYLLICLDSITDQKDFNNNIQVIVVNDGSTDKTGIIADNYAKKYENINVIHQSNQGVSSARNHGIEFAKGEYLWFVDGDDLVVNGSIKNICKIIQKHYPDMIAFNYKTFFDDKTIKDNRIDIKEKLIVKEFYRYFSEGLIDGSISYSPCDKIFKYKIIKENNLEFRKNLISAEDYYWCYDFFQEIKSVVFFDEVCYLYRKDRLGSATTTLSNENLYSTLDALEQSISDINLKFSNQKVKNYYLLYSSQLFFFNLPEFIKANLFDSDISDRFHSVYKFYINEEVKLTQFNRGAKIFCILYTILPWTFSVFFYSALINIRRYILMKIIRNSR